MLQTDAVLDKAQELKAAGTAFALATVVRAESPTSAKPGAKAIVTAEGELMGWIGGGCAQPAVLDTAKKALEDGQSRGVEGGTVEDHVGEGLPLRPIPVEGAGHRRGGGPRHCSPAGRAHAFRGHHRGRRGRRAVPRRPGGRLRGADPGPRLSEFRFLVADL